MGKTLSSDEMDKLTEEEQTWITDKDNQIAEAGKEYEGGSIQPMIESMKGAELTENRVRELIKLIPGGDKFASADKVEETDDVYVDRKSVTAILQQ